MKTTLAFLAGSVLGFALGLSALYAYALMIVG